MTIQGGNFGEEGHDEERQPPQGPQARPFGQDFIPPAYAGQPPAQPAPNAPHYPPVVPPWDPPPPDNRPPSGYGPPGYPNPPLYGGPPYPPPQYGPSYPPPGYGGGGYGGVPGYPGPYDPYQPYQSRSHETNGLAVGSLVTSISGVVLGILLNFVGIPIPIVGVVLGAVALNQIKRTGQQGRGLAIAGIAVGATTAVLMVIFLIAVMAAFTTSPSFR